jgi:hypothetical protein
MKKNVPKTQELDTAKRPEGVLIERPFKNDEIKHVNGNYAVPDEDEDFDETEDDLVLGDEDALEGDEEEFEVDLDDDDPDEGDLDEDDLVIDTDVHLNKRKHIIP